MAVTERSPIFHLKVTHRTFDCYLIVEDGVKKYEILGERRVGFILKENQSKEQLFDWFLDVAVGEIKKEIKAKTKI